MVLNFTEVNTVTSIMIREATPDAKRKHGIKAGVYAPTWEEVMEFSPIAARHISIGIRQLKHTLRVSSARSALALGTPAAWLLPKTLTKACHLINSGGVRQAPWAEGQNVRHLEPMGFIKFDLLGLSTLKMMEGCIEHVLRRHHNVESPSFAQVRDYL